MRTISELQTCQNPNGIDFLPILDIDGGNSGQPKTKKVPLAHVIALAVTGGLIKTSQQIISQGFLGLNQSEDILVKLPRTFLLINISSNIAGRFRLFKSNDQKEKDRARTSEVDPTGNHGVILETIFANDLLSIDLLPVVIASNSSIDYFSIFTSKSATSEKAVINFNYLPMEV
jgi:hypothetical protein